MSSALPWTHAIAYTNCDIIITYVAMYVCFIPNAVSVLLLPSIFGHSQFLCSHSNVIEAYNEPTGYCQAQGK